MQLFGFSFLANAMCFHDLGFSDFERSTWASVVMFVFAGLAAVVFTAIGLSLSLLSCDIQHCQSQ